MSLQGIIGQPAWPTILVTILANHLGNHLGQPSWSAILANQDG
jgi:hypothetical protein